MALCPFAYAKEGFQGQYSQKGLSQKFLHKIHVIFENQDELQLEDKQVETIYDLQSATKKQLIQFEATIDMIAVDITAELRQMKPNKETLHKLVEQKYASKADKDKAIVNAYIDQ